MAAIDRSFYFENAQFVMQSKNKAAKFFAMLVIGLQGSFKSLNLWEIQSKNNFVCEKAVIRIRVIARSGLWASGSSSRSWCH